MEMRAEVILKGTKVDGIYTADPMLDPTPSATTRFRTCRSSSSGLKVMDATAISLCMDNKLPIVVFKLRADRQPAPCHHGRAGRHDGEGLISPASQGYAWTSTTSKD